MSQRGQGTPDDAGGPPGGAPAASGSGPPVGSADPAPARRELAGRLRWQAAGCEMLGSPLYAKLLERAARDLEEGGPVWEALRGHESDPREEMVQLRLLGGVHRLALEGRAPALADCYPSTGGHGDTEATWLAFRDCLIEHEVELRASLERPVQTNEPGRARALVGGFLALAGETGRPLRLLELGASAGLNLRFDRYLYRSPAWSGRLGEARADHGVWSFGAADTPVRFENVFEGATPPPPPRSVTVLERAGCDRAPVDAGTEAGRMTLRSYVWPDQIERLRLLDAALEVAAQCPVSVERAGAAAWLAERLAIPAENACTVVFHSIVMQYLEAGERAEIDALMARAGAHATRSAPLARLAMEAADELTDVSLTLWPPGESRLIARAGYHGAPVRWLPGAAPES